jgi:hypothetical protein
LNKAICRSAFKEELDKFGIPLVADVGVAIDDFAGSLKYRLTKEFSGNIIYR